LEVQLNTDTNKFEQVKVKEVVSKVVLSFKDQIEKSDAVVDISSFEEHIVPGFKSYFNSIFYHLLSNALKYSDPARKQTITFSCVKINGNTHITVKDTGIGIDMRYAKDKIFTMYQRFHPEINCKGFGLFLVRSQLEAMGGTIAVESEVGKGTIFSIIFLKNK
ncbi:MAG: sensor histidine kinase, partial [Flammeovirgaceae bacterium]